MKISEQWLREWVDYDWSTDELAHQITMAGLEVDGVEPAAPPFEGVVVGEILACEPHPDADKLSVCKVSTGEATFDVVCGAPNARVGLRVPFATVGATLPGDMTIRRAKLRGVESFGMLCSERELGLSEDAAGLMELPTDTTPGADLREALALDDTVIEVDLTPNRGDCLGMRGVAREVGVLSRKPVSGPPLDAVPAATGDRFGVRLDAPEQCPRYVGRVVRGVDARAETPLWMRERLRRAGVRPLSVAVDVTNYVMLELGQPMHAFDLGRLSGGIVVRLAESGETLELLNGDTATLEEGTLVIADHAGPVALAGIMGGESSSVTDATADVFLEAAHFAPIAIAGRARGYGLHTDASHRFERGVDPQLPAIAMERATRLLVDIAGGTPGPLDDTVEPAHLPEPAAVALRPARVEAVLGAAIPDAAVADMLERLGFGLEREAEGWTVRAPGWRFDIEREVDLIEEVARIHGYDNLPTSRTPTPLAMGAKPERRLPLRRLRNLLVDHGYQEAITYSFVEPALQKALDPEHTAVPLANPISADLAVMRTSLWPGLVRALLHNRNRQHDRVRLFETGLRFRGELANLEQTRMIAGIATGPTRPEQWGDPGRDVDFYDIKGDVEALLALTGEAGAFAFRAESHPALHPGQSARILRDGRPVGWVGAIHPAAARAVDLDARTYVFELELDAVSEAALPAASELSRYPSIRRDLALIVDESVTAEAVAQCVRASAGEQLRDVFVFDVYRGKGVPDGCKSLAIGLILQDSSRTLVDRDVEQSIERVVGRLREELNVALRE